MEQINRRDLRRNFFKIQRFSVALFVLLLVCFYPFGEAAAEIECSHPSLSEGLAAMADTDAVSVRTIEVAMWPGSNDPAPEDDNIYFTFEPQNKVPTTGLIIHPGGHCDPRAYAPMAQAIASEGYLVAILPMPNCVSIRAGDRTAQVLEDFENIETWVLAGHSVGGASIARYVYEHGEIDGLVMLAALGHTDYPLDDTHNIKVLSLYGTNDTHLPSERILVEFFDLLPADTVYVPIEGGNHSQFAWLDPVPDLYIGNDGPADITYQEQQDIIVENILDFLGPLESNLNETSYRCDLDTSKTGYELAADFDECLASNAQIMTTHIENEVQNGDIDVQPVGFTDFGVFESNFAEINAEENWIKPIYIFFPEDMSAYQDPPDTINGAFVLKMKAKDKIEAYFGITIEESQGLCADVQEVVYDNVLNNILTEEQRDRYLAEGKSLSFIPDDDDPPASNPTANGGLWVGRDPATLITRDGDDYFFEPYSLYIKYDDPVDIPELLKGVRYCKLLSHQAILSWMLEKSFEEDPVLLTPIGDVCDGPSSLEARGGSCIIYFSQADSYYCSDYTGPFFDFETGAAKCDDRWDTSGGVLDPSYSTLPCSKRTAEIEASIPGYMGLTGRCVIHCKEENEFIWNIYTENPASSCTGFDFFVPEDDNGQCPVVSLLGDNAPQVISLRRFRDKILAKNAAGQRLIRSYYLHAGTINRIFDNHPTVRRSARWVLKSLIPILDKLL